MGIEVATITAALDKLEGHLGNITSAQRELSERLMQVEQRGAMHPADVRGALNSDVRRLRTADGRFLPWLKSTQKLADTYQGDVTEFSLGDFCRDAVCGSTKAASGAALVPAFVSNQIIDAVRARTVLIEAGAGTIVIGGPTNLARITSDPTVYQHTEGAVDILESDVVAVPVTLNPKMLSVLVPLTVELVQDSPNLDALLQATLGAAFAAKQDALGLATLAADVNIPKSTVAEDAAVWAETLKAVGSALALNQALPTAHIGSPADFIARASELASTAGSWLGKPPALTDMREFQTTSLAEGIAYLGGFADAFAIAVRQDLRVEVVRHAKPTSASHLLVAQMRADGVVLQPGKLYRQLLVP